MSDSNKSSPLENYLKRLAKRIKKDHGIKHSQALDSAAIELGFSGFNDFKNKIKMVPPFRFNLK
jgi:hypothetical protein